MTTLVVLVILVAIAVLAPRFGADTRWPGAEVHPDRPRPARRRRGDRARRRS